MKTQQVDYSLYLVTDSTEAILGSRDLVKVVEQALLGGVTLVQYRDKTSDTNTLITTAQALHKKCLAHNTPLLINDRVDVALAVDCEGVHLGQDDMSIALARKMLGPGKIIGATVSSVAEARVALERGADYLGIGTLYATNTKKNTKEIIGVNGIRKILKYLEGSEMGRKVKTVCIGGINANNIQRITHQLLAPTPSNPSPKTIDGAAIVSAIIGAQDPKTAAINLSNLLHTAAPFAPRSTNPPFWNANKEDEIKHILNNTTAATKAVKKSSPLSHNMTNLVVQNFAANTALAIGASPIMSNYAAESPDLSKLGGALVINMGTVTPDGLQNFTQAITAYNAVGGPIVFDPVGAGATRIRQDALATLMATSYFDLIKGNEREIMAVARTSGFTLTDNSQQHGVDSGSQLYTWVQRASIVRRLAARERNVVLMTGPTDLISDGVRTYAVSNGHAYLGRVTGTGCALGTVLSAYVAAYRVDKLLAAVAGLLHFEIAAERAAERAEVRGPGSFVPAFLDELWRFGEEVVGGEVGWKEGVRVDCVKDVGEEEVLKEEEEEDV
ncbi:TMP-TENI-domain-containing protein [Decorospora gaudefroyi]|uniref:TMP-TENI-domain-containing protein n=1 Tax=Decorospora gaudefroyi TaxID=184978 RepID=A0A6A5K599_9PLEO|nr:TMP-TENI-domain-containing protein [Decorospora gaudefroyi]